MTVRAVLFDKDGTLIDFSGTFGPATTRVLEALSDNDALLKKEMAAALDFDLIQEACYPQSVLIAGSLEDIAETLSPLIAHSQSKALAARIDRLYIEHSTSSLTPFPFTEETLRALSAMDLPLGIATNDSEEAANLHVKELKLADYFTMICGSDSGYGGKPKPGMVLAFANHCNLPAASIAMVGDSETDMKAARAAGAVAIAVASGEADARELQRCSDHVLPNIKDLPRLLTTLNQGVVS